MTTPQTVTCHLRMPDMSEFSRHITENARHGLPMVTSNSHVGKTVVICGAGPSLAQECHQLPRADETWACNSALPYLVAQGIRPTHGFAIDQGEAMLHADEWGRVFDVKYRVSSSVSPNLLNHLLTSGASVTLFHNYLGIPDPEGWDAEASGLAKGTSHEMFLYRTLYPTSVQVGHGLNAVPRAVCLASAMGFARIIVVGADCGVPDQPPMPPVDTPEYTDWMHALPMYASGRTAGQAFGPDALMAEAENLNGRRWHTRPDMVVSAQHLLELEEAFPGRVEIVGDVLPNALRLAMQEQGAAITDNLPTLTPLGTVVGFGKAGHAEAANEPSHTLEAA